MTTREDVQNKVKIKILNTPANFQGELVLDFKNTNSITVTLYPKFKEVEVLNYVNIAKELKIAGVKVVGTQQPAIAGCAVGGGADQDDTARTAINSIITALRAHGLIDT